jgi:hypothetical protein
MKKHLLISYSLLLLLLSFVANAQCASDSQQPSSAKKQEERFPEAVAQKVADLVISKMNIGEMPPIVCLDEMKKIGSL